jgi:hypothetical protein
VAINTQSLMDQQNHGEKVRSTADLNVKATNYIFEISTGRTVGISITGSLMPTGVALNAPVTQYLVTGLDADYINALQEKQKNRLRQAIPTADYVTSTSFKIGTKMLIKIEPTNAKMKEKLRDYIPNLVFDKFSLQAISEPDSERYQLHETFEDEVLFLFGRRPRVWTMQGIVVNGRRAPDANPDNEINPFTGKVIESVRKARLAKDMDWANRLIQDWDDFYRGSKAIEMQARTYLTYEDSIIEATLLELTVVRNAQVPSSVNAMITFVVHQRAFLGQEYREGFTATDLRDLIDKTNAAGSFDDKELAPEIKPLPASLEELQRQKVEAEEALLTAQQEVIDAVAEKAAVEGAKSESEKEYDQAKEEYEENKLEAARLKALADEATDPAAKERLLERLNEKQLAATEAINRANEIEQRRQAAEAQADTVNTVLDEKVTTEGNAQQVNDALSQAIVSAKATVMSTTYTEEDVVSELEERYGVTNVSDVTFKETGQGVFVEFTADYSDPAIGDGRTFVRVLK